MATVDDDPEKFADDFATHVQESLGDFTAFQEHGCLTLAQCALLVPALLRAGKPGDASEMVEPWLQLALLDIARGGLNPKHPETLLPYSQYLLMLEAGMYGIGGGRMPMPTADWLVSLDAVEEWLANKDIKISLDVFRAELTRMRAEVPKVWAGPDREETHATTYHQVEFPRLQSSTPWKGGMLAGADVGALAEAARFASKHAGTEITPADFLRAACRGQIQMRANCPRTVTMEPCRASDEPVNVQENSIATLPVDACKSLNNSGRATWRTLESYEAVEAFGGELGRFTRWQLRDSETGLSVTLDDCRLTGWDVHALADAFIQGPEESARLQTAPAAANTNGVVRNKLRKNSLDAPIEKAIAAAGSLVTSAVFQELKAFALNGEMPFTGEVEGDALCYTNDDNQPDKLSKNALDHRLRTRRNAA